MPKEKFAIKIYSRVISANEKEMAMIRKNQLIMAKVHLNFVRQMITEIVNIDEEGILEGIYSDNLNRLMELKRGLERLKNELEKEENT